MILQAGAALLLKCAQLVKDPIPRGLLSMGGTDEEFTSWYSAVGGVSWEEACAFALISEMQMQVSCKNDGLENLMFLHMNRQACSDHLREHC